MIEFPPSYSEPRLLKMAVNWAEKNKDHIPSLSALAPNKDVSALTELGQDWQKAGLGTLIEVSEEGRRSVLFSLNETAVSAVNEMRQRSLFGWLRSINRSDWISLASLIVAFLALLNSSD